MRRAGRLVGGALAGAVWLGACADDERPPATFVGGDVAQACSQRLGWTQAQSSSCLTCLVVSQQAPCGCPAAGDRGGLCESEAQAVRDETSCGQGADACALACDRSDCGCIEACYAPAASCRALASARDGCVAAACDSLCR